MASDGSAPAENNKGSFGGNPAPQRTGECGSLASDAAAQKRGNSATRSSESRDAGRKNRKRGFKGHAQSDADRPKKRRVLDEFVGRQVLQKEPIRKLEDVRSTPSDVRLGEHDRRLVEVSDTVRQLNPFGPHIVETGLDGDVNWVGIDKDRKGVSAYNGKIVPDRASADALANSILEFGQRTGSPLMSFSLKYMSIKQAETHREVVRSLAAQASGGAGQFGTEAPRAELEPSDKASDANGVQCANCDGVGHMVMHCWKPSFHHGSIQPCAKCNTKAHALDTCPVLKARARELQLSREYFEEIMTYLWHNRVNKPQLRSEVFTFFGIFASAFKDQSEVALAAEPKLNEPRQWPWTNHFARTVARMEPDDPSLEGKIHPKLFDPSKHEKDMLPVDPELAGKSTKDIIIMERQGFFDQDRFLSKSSARKLAALTAEQERMSAAVRKVVPRLNNAGTQVVEDSTVIKVEEDNMGIEQVYPHRQPRARKLGKFSIIENDDGNSTGSYEYDAPNHQGPSALMQKVAQMVRIPGGGGSQPGPAGSSRPMPRNLMKTANPPAPRNDADRMDED